MLFADAQKNSSTVQRFQARVPLWGSKFRGKKERWRLVNQVITRARYKRRNRGVRVARTRESRRKW